MRIQEERKAIGGIEKRPRAHGCEEREIGTAGRTFGETSAFRAGQDHSSG
jgi:hypothetical protein